LGFREGNRQWRLSCYSTLPDFCLRAYPDPAGGEIDVLDPAGYGTVTITKSVSIVNDGVGVAAIGASSGNAITINAGASDSVQLRGLTIEGLLGGGVFGIQFNTGGNLAIENCVIRNFVGVGIGIGPSTSSSFSVSNTIVSNTAGISVQSTGSASVTGVLSKVTANNNNSGIEVVGSATTGASSTNVTIVDSEASNNSGIGVFAQSASGHPAAVVMLRNSVASNNGTGLFAGQNAILRVAHSVVTGNGTGVNASGGGTIQSYGDNDINGNTNDNFGALTIKLRALCWVLRRLRAGRAFVEYNKSP